MPAIPPLGRSLSPLPEESLRGYVLRLSYRLNLSPGRIAERTGLTADGRSPARAPAALLTEIPGEAKTAFARMTRLTTEQVDQLVLASLHERYPLPNEATRTSGPDRRLLTNRTIFLPQTRFCPDCLAGDGTPIQASFGGPWRKTWHLPVVFVCPQHRRLLEHRCPHCEHLVHGHRSGATALLLPAMRARPLHPAQCRTPIDTARGLTFPSCCGSRLDQHGPAPRTATPELLELQERILSLLAPDGPTQTISAGQPTDPAHYFIDLQALTLLICSTWPATRPLSPSETTATAIDQHVDSLARQASERQIRSPATTTRITFDAPPADAAASAGLARIADHILQGGEPAEVREHLRALLPASTRKASRSPWGLRVSRTTTPCSPGLTAAFAPLLRTFTRSGGQPQARRDVTIRPQLWGPEHIPAFLPKDWYDRHFEPLGGVNPMFTRRTAVLRLVQMVEGGSLGEAAGHLGIAATDTTHERKGRIYSGAGHVHRIAKTHPDPYAFETALNALAGELDQPSTQLVNYQQRRRALEAWSIDADTWNDLIARLPAVPGPQEPELGDRKRQIASIYIWVQITSGEHHFAPRPIEAAQPAHIQHAWKLRRNTIWHLFQRDLPRPHYTGLKAELNALAAALARTIDAADPQPPTKPGNRHL